jgi:two-component system NtrC family sensor kinase
LSFVQGEFSGASIEVKHQPDPQAALVRADEGQLRQAFLNLLRNSIESMPSGGTLTVSTELSDGVVRVRIADTGEGIDQACLDRIFDPFFSTREGGTGLGLSLTQQIVAEHGGSIACESNPGQGTCFVVELPSIPAGGED